MMARSGLRMASTPWATIFTPSMSTPDSVSSRMASLRRRGDRVGSAAGRRLPQGAFARAVGAHDGVHFACVPLQFNALEDFVFIPPDVQILDFQQAHSRSSHWLRRFYSQDFSLTRRCLPG